MGIGENKIMRLGQIARKLNVGTTTIVQFLKKNGHVIENNPNTKVTNDLFVLLENELKRSYLKKEEFTQFLIENDNQPLNKEKSLLKSNNVDKSNFPTKNEKKVSNLDFENTLSENLNLKEISFFGNVKLDNELNGFNQHQLREKKSSEMEKTKVESSLKVLYPEGLLDWAGHSKGGVKKPFDPNSGRPNGSLIRTGLTQKLDEWIHSDLENKPRIILLVGGPGNGKTDALEYFISQIDKKYNSDYYSKISKKIHHSSSEIERTVQVALDPSYFPYRNIVIVQDASTGDHGKNSAECLLEDLQNALDNNILYLACINRGVLAEALSLSEKIDNNRIYKVLTQIIKGLTEYINPLSLWPMGQRDDEIRSFGIWPMDVESLVLEKEDKINSPFKQIFNDLLDDSKWSCSECTIEKSLCPFFQNKEALKNKENLNGLQRLLNDFESISNKRWSFREMFSLISYIMVGFEAEFKNQSPCDWAKSSIDKLLMANDKDAFKHLYELNSHHYSIRLFGKWPSFREQASRRNKEILSVMDESSITKQFFNYFFQNTFHRLNKPEIVTIVDGLFFDFMDPAQLSNNKSISLSELGNIKDLESSFSFSIKSGFEKTIGMLDPLQIQLFEHIIKIEYDLDNRVRFESSINSAKIDELLGILRTFAIRLFKRIHFSKLGISKDEEILIKYRSLTPSKDQNENKLEEARDLFDSLIQSQDGMSVNINSSISQPQMEKNSKLTLEIRRVSINAEYLVAPFNDVPRIPHKVFEIDFNEKYHVPLTYPLFKALDSLHTGVKLASLPSDVLAMLDSIKSNIAGKVVRDKNLLKNSKIRFGESKSYYRLDKIDGEELKITFI
jgi:hypothetical protein